MAFTVDGETLSHRTLITVDKDQVDATLSDKDVMVDLSDMPAIFWSTVKSDGGDIRATLSNGTTRLPIEVGSIDTGTDTGILWFKGSSVSSSTDTDFYIYYGNSALSQPAIDSTYGAENVWDGSHEAVWHLDSLLDSTANDHDLTNSGATSGQTGKIGESYNFDGNSDYLWNDLSTFAANTGTIEFWVKFDVDPDTKGFRSWLFGRNKAGNFAGDIGMLFDSSASQLEFFIQDGVTIAESYGDASSYAADTWFHIQLTWDKDDVIQMWVDGVKQTTNNDPGLALAAHADSFSFALAQNSKDAPDAGGSLDGDLDEFRIESIIRSDAWLKASNVNQDTPLSFYTVGETEVSVEKVRSFLID
jgi:hypothetical protein